MSVTTKPAVITVERLDNTVILRIADQAREWEDTYPLTPENARALATQIEDVALEAETHADSEDS